MLDCFGHTRELSNVGNFLCFVFQMQVHFLTRQRTVCQRPSVLTTHYENRPGVQESCRPPDDSTSWRIARGNLHAIQWTIIITHSKSVSRPHKQLLGPLTRRVLLVRVERRSNKWKKRDRCAAALTVATFGCCWVSCVSVLAVGSRAQASKRETVVAWIESSSQVWIDKQQIKPIWTSS